MISMRARLLLPTSLLLSTWKVHAEGASEYPTKAVHWIVPTSPGAGTDAAARVFAQIAADQWKQPSVVDNRSGASGVIGLDALATAAPDGYTLGFLSVSQFLDAILLKKYVFDASKDFTPISQLAATPLILVTNATTRLDTVAQLLAAARSRPKALNYASGGLGGVTHLAMEVFLKRAGIEVTHVPYKGSGPATLDLLAGTVQMGFLTPTAAMPQVKAGRLRALGVASSTRSRLAPEVPTFNELGLSGITFSTWYGLFGPANMQSALVDKIARTIAAAAGVSAMREKLLRDGVETILSTPAEFASFLKTDREQWLNVAKAINFKKES